MIDLSLIACFKKKKLPTNFNQLKIFIQYSAILTMFVPKVAVKNQVVNFLR